jgi:hypothetical protein
MPLRNALKPIHVFGWIQGASQWGKVVKGSPGRWVQIAGNCNQSIYIATFARHQCRDGAATRIAHQR